MINSNKIALLTGCMSNAFTSIFIVFINKCIFIYYEFPNMALTCIHFIFLFIGLLICLKLKLYEFKRLQLTKMIPLSILYCFLMVFQNLSLQYNTITTFQITKLLSTPLVMTFSIVIERKTIYSNKQIATLVRLHIFIVRFMSRFDFVYSFYRYL